MNMQWKPTSLLNKGCIINLKAMTKLENHYFGIAKVVTVFIKANQWRLKLLSENLLGKRIFPHL